GRIRALRQIRSLGEQIIDDLLLNHQNPQQITATLWSAVRARGCQFLGPAMQEEVLKLILLALMDGSALSRKVLVLFVVQKLAPQYPRASKTSVGHVVQLLYRASCFKVQKREDESSLMQLKIQYRTYEKLRSEHDAQIIAIAQEQGLHISPEQWSSLLYGDTQHKQQLESIIEKMITSDSFDKSIKEFQMVIARNGDPHYLQRLIPDFEFLEKISYESELTSTSPIRHFDSMSPILGSNGTMVKSRELNTSWQFLCQALNSSKSILQALIDYNDSSKQQNHQQQSSSSSLATSPLGGCGSDSLYGTDPSSSSGISSSTSVSKYKISMCRDFTQKGSCPRSLRCTFAHSKQEIDKFRTRNRRACLQLQPSSPTSITGQQSIPSPTPVQQYQSLLSSSLALTTTTNPLNGLIPSWLPTLPIHSSQTDNFLTQQQHYHHHHYHHLQQIPVSQTLQAPPMILPTVTSSTQIVAEAAQELINRAQVQAYYQHQPITQQRNPHLVTVQMSPSSHQQQSMMPLTTPIYHQQQHHQPSHIYHSPRECQSTAPLLQQPQSITRPSVYQTLHSVPPSMIDSSNQQRNNFIHQLKNTNFELQQNYTNHSLTLDSTCNKSKIHEDGYIDLVNKMIGMNAAFIPTGDKNCSQQVNFGHLFSTNSTDGFYSPMSHIQQQQPRLTPASQNFRNDQQSFFTSDNYRNNNNHQTIQTTELGNYCLASVGSSSLLQSDSRSISVLSTIGKNEENLSFSTKNSSLPSLIEIETNLNVDVDRTSFVNNENSKDLINLDMVASIEASLLANNRHSHNGKNGLSQSNTSLQNFDEEEPCWNGHNNKDNNHNQYPPLFLQQTVPSTTTSQCGNRFSYFGDISTTGSYFYHHSDTPPPSASFGITLGAH
ncbi:unnamed protein product, partial [Didymodactylos carnosus]